MAEEIRAVRESERDRMLNMGAQAFQIPADRMQQIRSRPDDSESLGLFVDGDLRVALNLIPMRVWFGGR